MSPFLVLLLVSVIQPITEDRDTKHCWEISLPCFNKSTQVYKDNKKAVTTILTTNRQPKEMLTIKELADMFGISRQAMRKHVDNLETTYLAKNSQGYKTVLWSGVLQLADKLGQLELFQETTSHKENPYILSDSILTTELLTQLKQKDIQIEQLQKLLAQQQKLIDQQQQLTLQANKQIERLETQERLTTVPEEKTDNGQENIKVMDVSFNSDAQKKSATSEKKWWHFFRKQS